MSITIVHPFRALAFVSLATVAAVALPAALRAQDGPTNITPAQQVESVSSDPCDSVGQGLPDSVELRTQACRADVAAGAERSSSASASIAPRGFDPCGSVGQGLADSVELRTQACRADVAAGAERSSSASASAFEQRMDDDPEFAACVRNATAHPEVPEHWYGYCAGK